MASKSTMTTRRLSFRTPSTLDADARSVEFVAATEDPVRIYDWEHGLVPEVLRMDGVVLPQNGQVPLIDTHDSWSVGNVLGSFSGIRNEGGELIGRATFATTDRGEDAFRLVREGHVTDVSVGYEVLGSEWVPDGQQSEIEGRTYEGPLRVTTAWRLLELSLCPIGADGKAKARNFNENGGSMGKRDLEGAKEALEQAVVALQAVSAALGGIEEKEEEGDAPLDDAGVAAGPVPADDGEVREEETKEEGREDAVEDDEVREDGEEDKEERKRCSSIISMCRAHRIPDAERDAMINNGVSLDKARAMVLDRIEARSGHVSVGVTEAQKVRSAVADALALRCGVQVAKPAAGAQEFRGMTMREVARDLLTRAGQSSRGTAMELVGRALATTDLPALLSDTANRVLLDGWENGPQGWKVWCGEDQVSDFKAVELIDFAAGDDLELVLEGGEYRQGKASENAETVKLETYGKIFPLTRQALVNDDLGAFSRLSRAHGEAAARMVNKLACGVLTANGAMADNVVLFHNTHRNLLSGGGAPTATTLGAAFTAMKTQKDVNGNRIQVQPQFFIAPAALEAASEVFFTSQLIGTQAEPLRNNIYGGSVLTRVYDAELDDVSSTDWYLAGPKGKTVTVFFLNGASQPYLEEKEGWRVDGIEYKVRLDVAAKAVAWAGLCKSAS